MIVENLIVFPTLIKTVKSFLNKNQCIDVIEYSKNYNFKLHKAITNNSKSTHSNTKDLLSNISDNVLSCKNVKDNITKVINDYSKETGLYTPKLADSWVNIQNKGSKLISHTHPGSVISGVIYLNVDDDSSNIYFYNPNPYIKYTKTTLDLTQYSYEHIWIKPNIGDLIIFPGWLSHGSDEDINQTETRIAMSFNTIL